MPIANNALLPNQSMDSVEYQAHAALSMKSDWSSSKLPHMKLRKTKTGVANNRPDSEFSSCLTPPPLLAN